VLGPAVDLGVGDAHRGQLGLDPGHGVDDELLPLQTLLVEHLGDFLVGIRVDEAEGKVFQLPLQFPHPEAVGQGGIEFQGFPGHVDPQVVRLGGVVAQGLGTGRQAQQHHPDVFHHGQEHLAQDFHLGLHLLGILGGVGDKAPGDGTQAVEPGNAAHQMGHAMTEALGDGFQPLVVVGGHRKQQGRRTGGGIQAQAGNDEGHTQGMGENPLAATQGLVAVGVPGIVGRLTDEGRFPGGKAISKGQEGLFEVALGGDGVDDGNHGAIIPPRGAIPAPPARVPRWMPRDCLWRPALGGKTRASTGAPPGA